MSTTGSVDDGEPVLSPADRRLKRLAWRCRRGTRELDDLLKGWLETHRASPDEAQLAAFDALLDQQDPQLWDWLIGHADPPRDDWRAIVADIRHNAVFRGGDAGPTPSTAP